MTNNVSHFTPNETDITIDETAKSQLRQMMSKTHSFVLSVQKKGCSGYLYDLKKVDDKEIGTDFKAISKELKLYLDPEYEQLLNYLTIYWVEEPPFRSYFHFENPNAKSTCGCGESFSDKEANQ